MCVLAPGMIVPAPGMQPVHLRLCQLQRQLRTCEVDDNRVLYTLVARFCRHAPLRHVEVQLLPGPAAIADVLVHPWGEDVECDHLQHRHDINRQHGMNV